MFETYENNVHELLDLVSSDKHQMKELVGIERRLSELEKRLNEAKKIARGQSDMTQVRRKTATFICLFVCLLIYLLKSRYNTLKTFNSFS